MMGVQDDGHANYSELTNIWPKYYIVAHKYVKMLCVSQDIKLKKL
jgi:hypothetical protein